VSPLIAPGILAERRTNEPARLIISNSCQDYPDSRRRALVKIPRPVHDAVSFMPIVQSPVIRILAIGASAGGVPLLRHLVTALPGDLTAAS
jgi:chemotaxis response regulator CheB